MRERLFDFYTHDGATALAEKLRTWAGGRLVVNIVEMPIKCPVAPLEFTFLADSFFTEKGMRDKVEIVYVTPLDAAFTKPIAAKAFGTMLEDKGVRLEPEFMLERVDAEAKALVSYDEREVPYDLLVTIPLNMGADFLARSGLGNELNLVPVDKQTLLSKKFDSIFALGDANDIPASKAGSVAHFEIEGFVENFLEHIAGRDMTHKFDGHANCFIETGHGKAMLIDFNYDTEPMPGKFPVPGVGPMSLLKETRANHLGQARIPLGLLEHPHARAPDADHGRPADGRQEGARRLTGAPADHIPEHHRPQEIEMPVTTIEGHEIHVDDEGFMTVYDEWDEALGAALAGAIGVEMSDEAWNAIRFMRKDFKEQDDVTPTLRRVSTAGGFETKKLFELFPKKPAKKMAYIAGLPKPKGCV